MYQYFEIKLRNEFVPEIIQNSINSGKLKKHNWYSQFVMIDQKYFRKIKIENIENRLEGDDKILLNFLLNENYVKLLSKEEFENRTKATSTGYSGVSGVSGTYGVSGVSGVSGFSGVSGVSGISGT